MLSSFTFLRIRFTIRARGLLRFGEYAGAALRGAFGDALLRQYCVFGFDECRPTCSIAERCGYCYLFKTPPSSHNLRGVTTEAPRPYVLVPVLERPEVDSGESFRMDLTLFGRATTEFPRVVHAVKEALPQGLGGGRVPCDLLALELLDASGNPMAIEDIPAVPPVCSLPLEEVEKVRQVTILLETPLHLKKSSGTPSTIHSFADLWQALTWRISLLGSYHCDLKSGDWRFPGSEQKIRVVDACLHWTKYRYYSSRQRQYNALSGLMGTITFAGELGPYLPYLRLGEITHVGSHCVFGLGKYRVIYEGG